ncbi:MAG: hypothetical protein HQ495_00185 [Alphaproteobacteria bacterium]|nr:hypothetical protein [Alphaproteobacteria bacterium]
MDGQEATRRLIEGGIGDTLAAAFAALAEATAVDGDLRFAPTVPRRVARAIACRSYATSLLQLCHFVNLADAAGQGRERYESLLFGLDRVSASAARGHLHHAINAHGWRRPGFEMTAEGVAITYRDGIFNVPYARMPYLIAVAELLIGVDDYAEIDGVFTVMLADAQDQRAIKDAANALARRLYRVLADQLPSAQSQDKYRRIVDHVSSGGGNGKVVIDDESVLGFWQAVSGDGEGGSDFRSYRTVLAAFVSFVDSVRGVETKGAMTRALRLGTDWEAGEVDPDALEAVVETVDAWRSPLDVLAEAPADRVKFFNKKESEFLRDLMAFGPTALDLPLSVLRADTFGATQGRITQALRRAGDDDLPALCACEMTERYAERIAGYQAGVAQQERIMFAVLHVLRRHADTADEDGAAENETVVDRAALAFRQISREGFREQDLKDPDVVEAYRVAAPALADAKDHVVRFLTRFDDDDLDSRFTADRPTFAAQFNLLYGQQL